MTCSEHGQISVYTGRFQRDEEQAAEAVSPGRRARRPSGHEHERSGRLPSCRAGIKSASALTTSCASAAAVARPAGARGGRLRPLAAAHPKCRAGGGFPSLGVAPPHAPPAPCVGLALAASRSRRDAPGCCRSGPCDTTGTRMSGRRDQVRRPLAGGIFLCNECTRRPGGPDNT